MSDVRPRTPGAAVSCLGVFVLAAVVSLCSGLPQRPGLDRRPGGLWAVTSSSAATFVGPAEDAVLGLANGVDQSPLALLQQRARDAADLAVPTGGAAYGLPVWPVVLAGLVLCALVSSGPRVTRRRSGARRHGTRAPPVWV